MQLRVREGGIMAKVIRCENGFCIYYQEDHCILREVFLDIQGNCSSCIYVAIEEDYLETKRNHGLAQNS